MEVKVELEVEGRGHDVPVELSGCLGLHGLNTMVVIIIIIIFMQIMKKMMIMLIAIMV